MADNIALNDLIEALAGAVIEAQDRIEQHQIYNLLGYFDKNNRPKSLIVRLPSITPNQKGECEDLYRAPLLPLVSTNLLKIKDVEVSFDVDLGSITPQPEPQQDKGETEDFRQQKMEMRKKMAVDMQGTGKKCGNAHIVLRVVGSEPTDGAARLLNHLAQTQGVYQTIEIE